VVVLGHAGVAFPVRWRLPAAVGGGRCHRPGPIQRRRTSSKLWPMMRARGRNLSLAALGPCGAPFAAEAQPGIY
jgi:hypothetical protein